MPENPTEAKLRERVRVFEEAIASFERARDKLLTRRGGANAILAAHIDHMLQTNARTLESLQRGLQTAKEEAAREASAPSAAADSYSLPPDHNLAPPSAVSERRTGGGA